jgi:hypothetical protein
MFNLVERGSASTRTPKKASILKILKNLWQNTGFGEGLRVFA